MLTDQIIIMSYRDFRVNYGVRESIKRTTQIWNVTCEKVAEILGFDVKWAQG